MAGFRVGIDVGGTNTDAVILDDDGKPVESTKTTTTENITDGILNSFDKIIQQSGIPISQIQQVMFGTTHCTNAIAERRNLSDVGVLRIGLPATTSIPPFSEWPDNLISSIGNNVAIIEGGHEYNGDEINELGEHQIRKKIRSWDDVDTFAVTSVFSPVVPEHENRVKKIIQEERGSQTRVSLSHEIGALGLIDRENATILNAALTDVAESTADSFLSAMNQRNADPTLYFARNDGTLMNILQATRRPIFMIASGPANSIRGAAHLSGKDEGIVIDVGGTTTDIGVIKNGFARKSLSGTEIGGVSTGVSLPDIISLPIGGGSKVDINSNIPVGPESVGRRLEENSRVFGGQVTTATDVEVAANSVSIGFSSVDIDQKVIEKTRSYIRREFEEAINQIRTQSRKIPAVVVGGASFLVPEDLEGVTEVCHPDYHDTANAVGVATAQVSGRSDNIYNLEDNTREYAVNDALEDAIENASDAGADPENISILSITDVPLSYLSDDVIRISVEVAGDLDRNGG